MSEYNLDNDFSSSFLKVRGGNGGRGKKRRAWIIITKVVVQGAKDKGGG